MKKLLQILFCLPVIGFGQNWNNDWDTDWSIFGWSKSGYVALFESHGYDLIGGCRYRLIIQNLKTDQIEDELILLDIEGDSDLCDSLTLLIKFDSEIDRLLAKYAILKSNKHKFYDLAFFESPNNFWAEFQIGKSDFRILQYRDIVHDFNHDCDLPYIMGLSIQTRTHVYIESGAKAKYVCSIDAPECSYGYFCLGYFKSPYEDRILLVFKSSISDVSQFTKTDYEFSGCSLNYNSFKLEPHY